MQVRGVSLNTGLISTFAGSDDIGAAGDDFFGAHASFRSPYCIVLNEITNEIYIADAINNNIRAMNSITNIITLLTGSADSSGYRDGAMEQALFSYPLSLAMDNANQILYVSENENHRYVIFTCLII